MRVGAVGEAKAEGDGMNAFGVIGAGSWGTALACLLAEHGRRVWLWCHAQGLAEEMRRTRANAPRLPGVTLPEEVLPTGRLEDLRECGVMLLVVPSEFFRGVCAAAREAGLGEGAVGSAAGARRWVSCTKGIERGTGKLMAEVAREELGAEDVGVLSGPNLAIEVARGIPAAAVLACRNEGVAAELQRVLNFRTFRVYTSGDVAGVQLGGALKNVYAIAAGICDGFGMGDNAKAALVTRSLAEMKRLGVALGGRAETFYGLSGAGDLMVTCFSRHSRNRAFGERVGRGEKPGEVLANFAGVAEGVPASVSAREEARKAGVETPVLDAVYAVLHEGADPRELMWQLLSRAPKPESV